MSAVQHAYEVQLADVLDPKHDYPDRRHRLRVHVGADHLADPSGRCGRCRVPWPCETAVTLGRLQGLEPPDDEPDDCPPECQRTGMCVRACAPLPLPIED